MKFIKLTHWKKKKNSMENYYFWLFSCVCICYAFFFIWLKKIKWWTFSYCLMSDYCHLVDENSFWFVYISNYYYLFQIFSFSKTIPNFENILVKNILNYAVVSVIFSEVSKLLNALQFTDSEKIIYVNFKLMLNKLMCHNDYIRSGINWTQHAFIWLTNWNFT